MSNYKYRFIKLMKTHSPIKRGDLTRRALSQLRINMVDLKKMITRCQNEKLIDLKKFPTPGVGGRVPDVFFLTAEGKLWLREKNREIKKARKNLG